MSFDNVVVINDSTPPVAPLEWLDDRPQTMIEGDIQDATPLEAGPPRGRIGGNSSASFAQEQSRARSTSPPTSAYPKDSVFCWEPSDVNNRYATDDDLYCLTPVGCQQMVENEDYKPMNPAFNPRQTILGSYFGR